MATDGITSELHSKARLAFVQPTAIVGGQNSWELGGVKMGFLRII